MSDAPSIYVSTYAKYNAGNLAGDWLNLEDYADSEDFYKACERLHSDEADPEYMFQTYSGIPAALYSESGGIDRVYDWLDLEDDMRAAVEIYLDQVDGNAEPWEAARRVNAVFDSLEDYAADYLENWFGHDNPALEFLWMYINLRDVAEGLLTGETYAKTDDGTLYIFET